MGDELLALAEVARIVGLPRKTIKARIAAGDLPAFRSGRDKRKILVRPADVRALLAPRPIATPGQGPAPAPIGA